MKAPELEAAIAEGLVHPTMTRKDSLWLVYHRPRRARDAAKRDQQNRAACEQAARVVWHGEHTVELIPAEPGPTEQIATVAEFAFGTLCDLRRRAREIEALLADSAIATIDTAKSLKMTGVRGGKTTPLQHLASILQNAAHELEGHYEAVFELAGVPAPALPEGDAEPRS